MYATLIRAGSKMVRKNVGRDCRPVPPALRASP